MPKPTIETAFAAIAPQPGAMAGALSRLRKRFGEPQRAYHNEAHTVDVLSRLYEWTDNAPTLPLIAAALYHDAVYDPTRSDNEARSAELCTQEVVQHGFSPLSTARAVGLIQMTAHHSPPTGDSDAVLLVDADLYILGSTPEEYETYCYAIRTEYAHVPEDAWRTGRAKVIARFLARPRIFHGDWTDVNLFETRARQNIRTEIERLQAG